MNLFKKIYSNLEDKILSRTDPRKLMVEAVSRNPGKTDSALYERLVTQAKSLRVKTLRDYKLAVSSASDPLNCVRQPLAELYENLMLDNHLSSVIDSRILYAQRSAFKLVNEKDEENTDITWLLERPWFDELIYKVLFSRFQGCTLIELYNLNEDGELTNIEEIPQMHFNPYTHQITANPDDSKGWNYTQSPFDTNYVQIGKPNDLGILEKLAPIVLAKKLALGSFQDYIDKYGVPPLFIITDRSDDTRLNQLFQAGVNFRSNGFIVGQGNEKIEIGKVDHGAGVPFEQLISRANDEISKRILGGAGLTDEKTFVGSSEIQYRLAKDRFESDKLYFKYVFNTHIKPRLIALSPAYKPLEGHYFEWDNTESLSMKEIIDAVNVLGNRFDIDPEYVERITGIPIIGQKQNPAPVDPAQQPSGGKGEKK